MKWFKTTIIPQGFLGQEFWQSSSWMFFASLFIDVGLHKWLGGKEFTCRARDTGSRPGSGASPGEGNGDPLQYPCPSVIHFLGTQGISLRVCGAENPSQGTWEPGALRVALNLGVGGNIGMHQ